MEATEAPADVSLNHTGKAAAVGRRPFRAAGLLLVSARMDALARAVGAGEQLIGTLALKLFDGATSLLPLEPRQELHRSTILQAARKAGQYG